MSTQPVYIYGDTVQQALNIARSRVKDSILTPAGFPSESDPGAQFNEVGGGSSLSTSTNPDGSLVLRTQVIANSAWRKMQKYLGNLGYRMLIVDNFTVSTLAPNANTDPTIQSWLSWNGFFNGITFSASPALPADFYAPLKLRERISGTNSLFRPMRCALDGIRPWVTRGIVDVQWEWRTNALYLPGSSSTTDKNFRYIRFLPDFKSTEGPPVNWYDQQLPIPGCLSAFAWYIAYEAIFQASEDPTMQEVAAGVLVNAELEANEVFNDQARADQRTNNRRRPRGGRSGCGWYGF